MADQVERIYKLTVEGAAAEKQLRDIAKSTDSVDKQMQEFQKSLSDMKKNLLGGIGVGTVVASFHKIVESMSEIVDSSQKLGVGTEELQKLRYAASITGVASGALELNLKKLSVGLADINDQGSEAAANLRALGVTSKDTAGTAIAKIADEFAKASDGAGKTAIAIKAFGKSGAEMVPLLNKGAAGIAELTAEFEKLGLLVNAETLGLFDQFGDQSEKLERVLGNVGIQIASGLLPALTAMTDSLVEAVTSGTTFKDIGKGIGDAAIFLASRFIELWAAVKQFASGIGAAAAALVAFFSGNFREAKNILVEWVDDTNKAGEEAAKRVKTLQDAYKNYIDNGVKPAAAAQATLSAAVKKTSEAFDELKAKMLEAEVLNDAQKEWMKFEEEQRKKLAAARAAEAEEAERLAALQQQEAEDVNEAQKAWANYLKTQEEAAKKQVNVTNILEKNFEAFFDNLQAGTADAADAFKRMAQSIIAQMLKLIAQWLIFKAFGLDLGGFQKTGGAFPLGGGGVSTLSASNTTTPTGASTRDATASASDAAAFALRLSPMPRTQAQGTNVQVNVHNNAAGVGVDVQTSDDGTRIDVIIERTRRALANDVRSGGGLFAKSMEATYALGRARAG